MLPGPATAATGRSQSQAPVRLRHAEPRTLPTAVLPEADAWTPLVQLPTVSTAGSAQGAKEAMEEKKRSLEKPEGSRGCLLRRDLEKGHIHARPPVKIDESNNEEKDPHEIDPEDLPGDPRLERVATARHNEILSGSRLKLPPEHLDMEQRKRMTADPMYRPEVSEHFFPSGHFPRSWGSKTPRAPGRLFLGATPPPIFDTHTRHLEAPRLRQPLSAGAPRTADGAPKARQSPAERHPRRIATGVPGQQPHHTRNDEAVGRP